MKLSQSLFDLTLLSACIGLTTLSVIDHKEKESNSGEPTRKTLSNRVGHPSLRPDFRSVDAISHSEHPETILSDLLKDERLELASFALESLAQESPSLAIEWFERERKEGVLSSKGIEERWRQSPLLGGLAAGLVSSDPTKAWSLFLEAEKEGRSYAQERLTFALIQSGDRFSQVSAKFNQQGLGKSERRKLHKDLTRALIQAERLPELREFLESVSVLPSVKREGFIEALISTDQGNRFPESPADLSAFFTSKQQADLLREVKRRTDARLADSE